MGKSFEEQQELGLKADNLLAEGKTIKQIAKEFGVSHQTVNNWRTALKTGLPAGRKPGRKKKPRAVKPVALSQNQFFLQHDLAPAPEPRLFAKDKIIIIETQDAGRILSELLGR